MERNKGGASPHAGTRDEVAHKETKTDDETVLAGVITL